MEKMFLTNGGNLLRFHPNLEKFYFQKPDGEFLREVSNSEAEFLCQNCLEVDVHFPNPHPEFLPIWHFIKSVCVLDDYTNFKSETSCNGGDYSFHTFHDWYVAKYPDGSWKFAFVERHSTSADFSYTELGGNFDPNPGTLYLTNANMATYSMGCSSHDDVLEKVGQMSCFEDMWTEQYEYIPSKWDNEDKGYIRPSLSFSDKKEIITRLKELGVEKVKPLKSPRGNRGGKGGGRR